MFKLHDLVYVRDEFVAEIIHIDAANRMYSVRFVDSELIPPVMIIPEYQIQGFGLGEEEKREFGCTCGASCTSNPKFHLEYCDET